MTGVVQHRARLRSGFDGADCTPARVTPGRETCASSKTRSRTPRRSPSPARAWHRRQGFDLSFAEFGDPERPYTAAADVADLDEASNPSNLLVGRQGLEPWTLGLKGRIQVTKIRRDIGMLRLTPPEKRSR